MSNKSFERAQEALEIAQTAANVAQDEARKRSKAFDKEVTKRGKELFLDDDFVMDQERYDYLIRWGSWNTLCHAVIQKWMASFHPTLSYDGSWWVYDDSDRNAYKTVPMIKLTLTKDQPVDGVLDGLQALCAPTTQHTGKDVVLINIFEETLSEYGFFHLEFDTVKLTGRVTKTTYGREKDEFTGSIVDALTYISHHHWYRRP